MKVAFIAFTRRGYETMQNLAVNMALNSPRIGDEFTLTTAKRLADEVGLDSFDDLGVWTGERFADSDALVFIGATGIAVRAIAPHVRDKFSDPAVVSVDEAGQFAVPLLSGHVGGANDLAREVAAAIAARAVVSTATDVNGLFAVDEWARKQGLALVERQIAKEVSACLLDGGTVGFASDIAVEGALPSGVEEGPHELGIKVGLDTADCPFAHTLHLVPRVVTVGVGCKRGIDAAALEAFVRGALANAHISPAAVARVASIDVKHDEEAVLALARALGCEPEFYSAEQLAAVEGTFASSDFVKAAVGVDNVCERAAVAGGARLIGGKEAHEGMTVALGQDEASVRFDGGAAGAAQMADDRVLLVVGIGPGGGSDLTRRAYEALESCDVIVGYTVYTDLLEKEFPDKEMLTTPMRREVERCKIALERAQAGERVAMVCSGDPGVYGMAGLCYELAGEYPSVDIEVIPGISAAFGGAAVLGAPLMHDFAVISLSDLMTPWEKIAKRLELAAEADFVICLYNPSSKKRADYLQRACDILLRHKPASTICGTVRNIGREGEESHVLTLGELRNTNVDMFTTVYIGNEQTMQLGGSMVTPRGYLQREGRA
ncbi:MAG: precorrin-3B C(17)-methyltransferase [Coriobacteriales bacterium]|nr:precorrin-3B C(17)-methyltransferase [Coriobacteriales bacterium]